MKNKKLILCFLVLSIFTKFSFAQFFLNSAGLVSIGSVGSAYDVLDVWGSGTLNPLELFCTQPGSYGYSGTNNVDNSLTKAWAVQYNGSTNFFVYGGGQTYSTGNYIISDERKKENINTINNALSKVLKLRGVNFNYRPQEQKDPHAIMPLTSPALQMGLIAQEVEKVVPEVVSTMNDGYKAVEYSNLIGLLIEGMKEQNKRIDSLQSIIVNCCENNQLLNSTSNPSANLVGAALYQNNPNPFTQQTSISYFLPSTTQSASLMITDMDGKMLKSIPVNSYGQGAITINGGDFSSGMYYYTLIADGKEIGTKKMILTQ